MKKTKFTPTKTLSQRLVESFQEDDIKQTTENQEEETNESEEEEEVTEKKKKKVKESEEEEETNESEEEEEVTEKKKGKKKVKESEEEEEEVTESEEEEINESFGGVKEMKQFGLRMVKEYATKNNIDVQKLSIDQLRDMLPNAIHDTLKMIRTVEKQEPLVSRAFISELTQ